jgi:hypothetical protein
VRNYANLVCSSEAEKDANSYVEIGAIRILKVSRSTPVVDFLK